MKKLYSKPGIVYEDFSMCTHIAKTCDVELGTFAQGTCGGYSYGSFAVFLTDMIGCDIATDDSGDNKICYHVPINGARLFNS